MNSIREIENINKEELDRGIAGTSASWHQKYLQSAWIYVGNLDHELTEGDIICVVSQYGEVEDIHLVREEDTGKSRGFAFVKYEDSRSCVLAVDNFVGFKLLGRPLRVDHVEKYRLPKKLLEDEEKKANLGAGHAYDGVEMSNKYSIQQGQDLFAPPPQDSEEESEDSRSRRHKKKKKRKHKESRKSERKDRDDEPRSKDERRRKKHRSKKRDRRYDSEEDGSQPKTEENEKVSRKKSRRGNKE